MAENGKDEDYNKEPYRLMPLKTPPYYGIRTGAWFLATLDGVRIDTNMHPFREDGSEIEGLYMAGDCSGGFFSTSYPNLFTGLACGRTMVEGRRRHAGGNRAGVGPAGVLRVRGSRMPLCANLWSAVRLRVRGAFPLSVGATLARGDEGCRKVRRAASYQRM